MATACTAAEYTSEKNQLEGRRILNTFVTEEQFEPFAWETITTTIIADDELFEDLHIQRPYPKIPNCEKPAVLEPRGIFARRAIRGNEEGAILHISGIADCVGVVLKGAAYSGAYHASFMDLREFYKPQELNKNGNFAKWLNEYKAKEINFSKAKVFVASSFWTQNADDVIALLTGQGFDVHYMSIPDLQLKSLDDANRKVFISSTSPYLERVLALQGARIPLLTQLAVDTQTGAAWCEHFLRC